MTISIVNHQFLASGAGPWTIPAVTAGNAVLVYGYHFNTSTNPLFSIGDGSFVPCIAEPNHVNGYLLLNATGGETSLSLSWSGATAGQYAYMYTEISGLALSPLIAATSQSQTDPGTASGAVTSGTVSVPSGDVPALIIGCNYNENNLGSYPAPANTLLSQGQGGSSSYALISSSGSYACSATDATHGSSYNYDSFVVALQAASVLVVIEEDIDWPPRLTTCETL